ncbi:MAG: membrane protein insertase YidC, partial [Pseudobdellovibrionaceae bacterium]
SFWEKSVQNNHQTSPFDPKFIIAMIAVGAVYFGWQTYLSQKYPNRLQTAAVTVDSKESQAPKTPAAADKNSLANNNQVALSVEQKSDPVPEKILSFDSGKASFQISSQGMGLLNYQIKSYEDRQGGKIKIGAVDAKGAGLFALLLQKSENPIPFVINEVAPGEYEGTYTNKSTKITRRLKFNEANYSFESSIQILSVDESLVAGFLLRLPDKINESSKGSLLFPSYEHQDFIIEDQKKKEVVNFNHAKENIDKVFKATHLLSVGSQYFASAILDQSDITPDTKILADINTKHVQAEMVFGPFQAGQDISFKQILFAGPKVMEVLKASSPDLSVILDHGFFGFISKPLLEIMKAFYGISKNWGVAIILLTLLVRLCVLPFNIMSFKSMKAMQQIQPQVQGLREKYKDDPMTLNKEMMALMKENKANPLGGCLPMLLQIPIFFALYKVIGSSVELYQSPFFGWIQDLSAHDKFYVLPVLMGISMFLQQKLTPMTTMDPTQAKIMMFLPVVFSLFMLNLPSGLTLYMFVSTVFGITQQKLMLGNTQAKTPVLVS